MNAFLLFLKDRSIDDLKNDLLQLYMHSSDVQDYYQNELHVANIEDFDIADYREDITRAFDKLDHELMIIVEVDQTIDIFRHNPAIIDLHVEVCLFCLEEFAHYQNRKQKTSEQFQEFFFRLWREALVSLGQLPANDEYIQKRNAVIQRVKTFNLSRKLQIEFNAILAKAV
ncbi:MAG: hypothetical protein MRY78_09040 [Saprospiraceae bacterium]|nr:hypothetical protein [Saprospiraceae bacterium]